MSYLGDDYIEPTEELNQDQNFVWWKAGGACRAAFFYKLRGQLSKKSLKLALWERERKVQGWLIFICGLVLVKSQLPGVPQAWGSESEGGDACTYAGIHKHTAEGKNTFLSQQGERKYFFKNMTYIVTLALFASESLIRARSRNVNMVERRTSGGAVDDLVRAVR